MKADRKKELVRRLVSVFSIIGFIICSVCLLYPVISDRWNRYRDMQLITEYNQAVKMVSEKDYTEFLKKATDYNEYLRKQNRNIVTDAAYEPDDYYETLLNLTGNGMMGYIEIPKIDITEPIYHYSTEVSLGQGVGHIHGSSLPTGGINTHSVLTGHRGLPNQKFFSDLDKMKPGDRFYIHLLGKVMAYEVYRTRTIEPTDVEALMIEENQDLVPLVTCTPYGVNTHRLLVMGKRVEYDENAVDENGFVTGEKHAVMIDPAVWVVAGFGLFLLIFFAVTLIRKIRERKKRHRKDERET